MTFFLEERRKDIFEWILQKGRVSVSELSDHYGVSEVTIRNDLQALEDQQLILRTHGGAIPGSSGFSEIDLKKRIEKQVEQKSRIGEAAAARISNGETIFLDSSTTAIAITRYLNNFRDLTVVTNSLAITQELIDVLGTSVVLLGGLVYRDDASTYGWLDNNFLDKLSIQKGFFGAHGISMEHGVTDLSPAVAEVKRAVLPKCQEVIVVIDATKWGKVGLASFASLEKIDLVITDLGAPHDLFVEMEQKGIQVMTV